MAHDGSRPPFGILRSQDRKQFERQLPLKNRAGIFSGLPGSTQGDWLKSDRGGLGLARTAVCDTVAACWTWLLAVLLTGGAGLLTGLRALRGLPWRRTAQVGALSLASGMALASTLVAKGYLQHPPEWVAQRLDERKGHGLYSQEEALMGALFVPVRGADGKPVDQASLGYLPLQGELPPLYVQLLLALEHQGHFNPWRNWCGTDPVSVAMRVFTGTGGGSTLTNQLAKQLMEPDEPRHAFKPLAVLQKFEEMGAACAVHRQLGGANGVLRAFADVAPVAQVAGTSRGLASGAQVLFGTTPAQASGAMLAVLAALVQRPLSLAPASAFAKGCQALRDVKRESLNTLTKDELRAKSQCHVLARARVGLKTVLPHGPALDSELAQIGTWERSGIQPVDTFSPVPAARLVNVSERGRILLSANLLNHVAEQADAAALESGASLTLSFNGGEQLSFRQQLAQALVDVDASTKGRELLCVTMTAAAAPRHCQGVPAGHGQAELVLVRARVVDGRITRLHHSTLGAYQREWQLGSLAKLVILTAALHRGLGPDSLVCPRAARADGRVLRRETRPVHGFAKCGPAQLISLAEATATSDGLAYFDLAQQLGPPALQAAAKALGIDLDPSAGQPAYALAFGTATATPAQMLAMGQAVFALAEGVAVQAAAPQLLQLQEPPPPVAWQALRALLPQAAQHAALRTLVRAPVSHPRGTLSGLAGVGAAAGKSGTTSSPWQPVSGARPYQQTRLSLTWQPADQTVALAILAGNAPQPLGQARLPAEVIHPIRSALLR